MRAIKRNENARVEQGGKIDSLLRVLQTGLILQIASNLYIRDHRRVFVSNQPFTARLFRRAIGTQTCIIPRKFSSKKCTIKKKREKEKEIGTFYNCSYAIICIFSLSQLTLFCETNIGGVKQEERHKEMRTTDLSDGEPRQRQRQRKTIFIKRAFRSIRIRKCSRK